MKKGGFLRNVLDTIRSNQVNPNSRSASSGPNSERAAEFGGQLKSQHLSLGQVTRHGFPDQPSALAFDPVQKIAAIGTKTGAIRIFGRPGVDVWAQHESAYAVTFIKFIVNQGALITVTSDDSIHLWSLRGPKLKLQLSSNATSQISPGAAQTATATTPTKTQLSSLAVAGIDTGLDATEFIADQLNPSPVGLDPSKRQPEIIHTLKFQREHITYLHQTVQSKWLYIGTERGNVHVVNVETFELSGYSIAWNKAIELSRKTHPGVIIHISECPQDSNKLLIGYESGCIVLWDLKNKTAEGRYYHTENLLWLAWHYEGKQFVAAHGDGSLVTWQTRSNARPSHTIYPHAKVLHPSSSGDGSNQSEHVSFTTSISRSLNRELLRPINKVDWKTARNNDQFLLFSGGLPYDGLESVNSEDTSTLARLATSTGQQSSQQYLKASSVSPNAMAANSALSPLSPSISPGSQSAYDGATSSSTNQKSISRQSNQPPSLGLNQKEKKCLRSTSLTLMIGKSITVLEMEETIIDFITICDNSPYENDTSDPFAVIVLLSNELILIDLTSSGYPTFDSPYPSASLNESPVTCVHYLADCSSDLIPFLYSTSQNVISRAPKKGFSDKEWPINGGDWGQSLQSYPELVITGHSDGTIKFWDMSSVNFDLISKIKTSKLFERPNKLTNSIILPGGPDSIRSSKRLLRPCSPAKPAIQAPSGQEHSNLTGEYSSSPTFTNTASNCDDSADQLRPIEDVFAIEKIEFNSSTKHLLVAGALAQVIQFKLNKKDSTTGASNTISEITTIDIEVQGTTTNGDLNQHQMLKVKSTHCGSTSGSSSSSSSSHGRSRGSGFQAEIICLTPLIMQNTNTTTTDENLLAASSSIGSGNLAHICFAPPRVTAIALQSSHNILAYAHENGIVLVDIIQKCTIMNASLNDLYGGASSLASNRDISIKPYATSSILPHHYQCASANPSLSCANSTGTNLNTTELNRGFKNNFNPDNGSSLIPHQAKEQSDQDPDCAVISSSVQHKHDAAAIASDSSQSTGQHQSRLNNSLFQRQLSTNALLSSSSKATSASQRLFQRQMTASNLMGSGGSAANVHEISSTYEYPQGLAKFQRPARPQEPPADHQMGPKKTAKNKRIISRMLSISAIHTTVTGNTSDSSLANANSGSGFNSNTCTAGNNQSTSNGSSFYANCESASASANCQFESASCTNQTSDQQPDKFDSSFTRSRSSSGSSSVAQLEGQLQGGLTSNLKVEFIQTLCFLQQQCQASSGSTSGPKSAGALQMDNPQNATAGQLGLFLGTSSGCVLLLNLQMPDNEDNRILQLQSVNAEPVPQATIKLPGAILSLSLFSSEASRNSQATPGRPGVASSSQSSSQEGECLSQSSIGNSGTVPTSASNSQDQSNSSASRAQDTGPNSGSFETKIGYFLAIVSEKQARVYQIPSIQVNPLGQLQSTQSTSSHSSSHQTKHSDNYHHPSQSSGSTCGSPIVRLLTDKANCVSKWTLSESSYACRSQVVQMRQPDESCLVSYLATGNIVVHALPKPRLLIDVDFVPYSSPRIASSMCFSRNGHCLYQPSMSEICKFTISAQYKSLVGEMLGSLYVPKEMPEMPRANFFKSLFSVASSAKQSDRDELFGECSAGKPSRGVAKHIGGTGASLDKLKGAAVGTMGHEMRMAREGLDERGEKLSEIEDRTLQMMNASENYSQAAHQLAQKYKDKKWYQF